MSLATNLKSFADVLHNIYAQQLSSVDGTDVVSNSIMPLAVPKIVVVQEACVYLAKSLGNSIISLLTFQWLRDFSYFPLLSNEITFGLGDKINTSSLGISPSDNIIADTFLSEPGSHLFSFSRNGVALSSTQPLGMETSKESFALLFNGFLKSDCLLAGLVNSFFFSLPFSLPHLITLRRTFSQGVSAAIASIFGTVAAHSLLLLGVIYGIRWLIIPYYSLQPLTFLIGIVVMAIVITEFVKEKKIYLVPLNHYPSLLRIGLLNFVVALCESAILFHDLHHLTLNQEVSYLQLYNSNNALDSFFSNTTYLIAFVLGHIAFSFLFCFLLLKAHEKACSLTGWTLGQSAKRINKGLLITLLTLTFASFPYYGLDYLFTKSAGFLPEDPAYSNTIFSPTQVRSRNRHFKTRAPATKNAKTPLELDLNYFDRGMYLNAPKEEKIPLQERSALVTATPNSAENPYDESIAKTSNSESLATYDPALTFEELNYQGEVAWLMRHERARRLPDEQDSKKSSLFQKPKSHFKELRLKQDNKQASAALKEATQLGSISEWKEGMTPGENFLKPRTRNRVESHNPLLENRKVTPLSDNLNSTFQPELSFSSETKKEAHQRGLLKELLFDREVAANYEKSFTSPFGEESDGTPPDLLPVENIIKKRYRLNPVYRAILQSDIDSFIARQPANYKITQNQEAMIFKKRSLLEKYYNSIRYYSPLETTLFNFAHAKVKDRDNEQVIKDHLFDSTENLSTNKVNWLPEALNPKSFGEMVYHQQFKGTLNTVKRFFKLTFDDEQNPNKNRILSYDQALYKKTGFAGKSNSMQATDRSNHEKNNPSLHEELSLEKSSPFLEESNSAPIYAGWDEKARRFVITNRFRFIE